MRLARLHAIIIITSIMETITVDMEVVTINFATMLVGEISDGS